MENTHKIRKYKAPSATNQSDSDDKGPYSKVIEKYKRSGGKYDIQSDKTKKRVGSKRGLEDYTISTGEDFSLGNLDDLNVDSLKIKLKDVFQNAFCGVISVEDLYLFGTQIEEKMETSFPEILEDPNYKGLQETFAFIDQLHDSKARSYNRKNIEQIQNYLTYLRNN